MLRSLGTTPGGLATGEARRDPLPITQELQSFTVREIHVNGDALVLNLDFTLMVK